MGVTTAKHGGLSSLTNIGFADLMRRLSLLASPSQVVLTPYSLLVTQTVSGVYVEGEERDMYKVISVTFEQSSFDKKKA